MTPLADVDLARRLERAEGEANARFVEARAAVDSGSGAAWVDVDGTYAMFDGPSSPCTQTFGFGLFAPPSARALEAIERFFAERSAPVFHEVCPIAEAAHLELLSARAYRPIELSNVLYRSIAGITGAATAPDAPRVRIVGADEGDRWAQTLADGWRDVAGVGGLVHELAGVFAARSGSRLFLAEHEGRAVAAGSSFLSHGVALLAGASTVPEARRRGAQSALLAARLHDAAQHGCDIAMVVALPGSGSQRNAERNGFRVAYTRTKWHLLR